MKNFITDVKFWMIRLLFQIRDPDSEYVYSGSQRIRLGGGLHSRRAFVIVY